MLTTSPLERTPGRRRWTPLLAVPLGAVAMAVTACGSTHTSTSTPTSTRPASAASPAGPVVARTGALEIIHPYLPDPASPSVAAVYLTVRNTGPTSDTLVSVTSPAAPRSMLMTEQAHGDTGTMAPLAGLVIPAGGEASLLPGDDHVMLEQPEALHVGGRVALTLRFRRAAPVTVEVPVVPLSAMVDNDGDPVPTTAGMAMGGQAS